MGIGPDKTSKVAAKSDIDRAWKRLVRFHRLSLLFYALTFLAVFAVGALELPFRVAFSVVGAGFLASTIFGWARLSVLCPHCGKRYLSIWSRLSLPDTCRACGRAIAGDAPDGEGEYVEE